MALRTLVKVGEISNLSDARYCAGMGVDMLGFGVLQGQAHSVSPTLYQEIRGWVSGPSVVAEIYGLKDSQVIASIIDDYRPDYFECTTDELPYLIGQSIPKLMVRITNDTDIALLSPWKADIAYALVSESQTTLLQEVAKHYPVIVSVHSPDAVAMLETFPVQGLALNGSTEIRPGQKDYDHLADILEQLEQD